MFIIVSKFVQKTRIAKKDAQQVLYVTVFYTRFYGLTWIFPPPKSVIIAIIFIDKNLTIRFFDVRRKNLSMSTKSIRIRKLRLGLWGPSSMNRYSKSQWMFVPNYQKQPGSSGYFYFASPPHDKEDMNLDHFLHSGVFVLYDLNFRILLWILCIDVLTLGMCEVFTPFNKIF